MSELPSRSPRRRNVSLPRQAAEGVGLVVLLALGVAAVGFAVALVVSWVF